MKTQKLFYIFGFIFLLISVYMSVFLHLAHFYSLFSIGMFLILFQIYNSIYKKSLFNKWKLKDFVIFFISLIIVSIIIDKIGIYLGYWIYPFYNTIFDEILKYIFEWALALTYFMAGLMIGICLFKKARINKQLSFLFSLLIFVTLIGFFTQYINQFSYSWKVLSMPITNYKIGGYFLIFQTVGYWLMAIIPFILYKIVDKRV